MEPEARITRETGVPGRIALLAEPIAEDLGFRLVRVRITGQNGCTVQVMAERDDGTMSIEDCTALSRALSAALDVEDPIRGEYNLEVSSPGIDRPLVRPGDFSRWAGHEAKIETAELVDGRKRFRGRLAGIDEAGVHLQAEGGDGGAPGEIVLPANLILDARLVLTDALIEQALKGQALKGSGGAA
jgi:ribosome maturation factor RimP